VILEVHDLTFAYDGKPVVHDVSLDLPEGELLGLVGPNGAGKSTLLACLHRALRPQRGTVLVGGADVARLSAREIARRIAVVPQTCNVVFPVSVAHFVGLGRYARESFLGGPTLADRAIVKECLDEMGLGPIADRPIDEISGGEFRRALIAQALAQQPAILLFDEPVQQLDLLHQLEVMEFARRFTRRGGTAGLVVLHDLGLAARYCDRIALLHEGRVVAVGTPEEVLTPDAVRRAYGVEALIRRNDATGAIEVVPLSPARPA
jgi:iron complex transport system ATP-binding protein